MSIETPRITCAKCAYERQSSSSDIRRAHETKEGCPECGTILIDEGDWATWCEVVVLSAMTEAMKELGIADNVARCHVDTTPLRSGGKILVNVVAP